MDEGNPTRRRLQGRARRGRAAGTDRGRGIERRIGIGRVVRRRGAVRRGRGLGATIRNVRQEEREEAAANALARKKEQIRVTVRKDK